MPESASTRLALVGPSGTDGIPLGDDVIRAIITQLEAVGAAFTVGTYASRPSAGAAYKGVFYIASDTGVVSVGTTSSWIEINPKDAAAATASLRTLGTGATQAAAGDHDHASTYQPLDADLTAIAALSTASFGRSVLAVADAAALRTLAGLAVGAWASPTFPTGVSGLQYRAEGVDVVRLRGALLNASGSTITTGNIVATLPSGSRPSQTVQHPCVVAGVLSYCNIGSNGIITLNSNLATATSAAIDGITFSTT